MALTSASRRPTNPTVATATEVVIDDEKISMRFATGLGIEEAKYLQSQVTPLSKAEMRQLLPDVNQTETGFRVSDNIDIDLLFVSLEGQSALVVRGMMGDLLGPTVLLTPEQVAAGEHDKIIAQIEENFGAIPRLDKNGLAA